MNITQEELKERLTYNPETGIFVWITNFHKRRIGIEAGSIQHDGYVKIFLNGKPRSAHRLAWLYVNGKLPDGEIDHLNRIRHDNRICNLRDVNKLTNHQNKKMDKRNSSGVQGVHWNKGLNKWMVRIGNNGKRKHLGYFENFEEAVKIRKQAELELNYHPNHGNSK